MIFENSFNFEIIFEIHSYCKSLIAVAFKRLPVRLNTINEYTLSCDFLYFRRLSRVNIHLHVKLEKCESFRFIVRLVRLFP